jgi:hypothetical protein
MTQVGKVRGVSTSRSSYALYIISLNLWQQNQKLIWHNKQEDRCCISWKNILKVRLGIVDDLHKAVLAQVGKVRGMFAKRRTTRKVTNNSEFDVKEFTIYPNVPMYKQGQCIPMFLYEKNNASMSPCSYVKRTMPICSNEGTKRTRIII